MKKSNHSAAFKRKVALEAIREHKTTSEIAAIYEVHPIQVGKWKKQLLDGIDGIFESPATKRKSRDEKTVIEDSLHEKIGRLTMELDWLKKRLEH